MLEELRFVNYRCFDEHRLPLRATSVIVGRNNAGKSTVIEGFRLLSIFSERYPNLNFQNVPPWADLPRRFRGMQADLGGLSLSWQNLFHQYRDPPAKVSGTFSGGTEMTVHLGPDERVHTVVLSAEGATVQTKGQARTSPVPAVRVLPQVAPLMREEVILRDDYVRSNLSSYLAPQHFRNQLRVFHATHYEAFTRLVEATWPGLQIIELQGREGHPGEPLGLLVRDGDFVAEVAWMGHGVQMWLQTMWFVVRTPPEATVVLDEPDVYLHPDLQRKLVRFLKGRFSQVIIATHSTEILAEVPADDVLIIDRQRHRSRFATDLPAVQQLVNDIGSVQNLALTRLWTGRRLILVEGKDMLFLRRFHELLFPQAETALDALPNMPIGGWTGWPYAIGGAMVLTNAGGEDVITYCILDSDYHTPEQIRARRAQARARSVELHIWSKKEIENYLIRDDLIHRVIGQRTTHAQFDPPTLEEVRHQIDEVCDALRDQTTDNYAQEFLNEDRHSGIQAANREARALVAQAWGNREDRVSIVSGKDLISGMSSWAQQRYQASFGVAALLSDLRAEEIDEEVRELVRALEEARPLGGGQPNE